MRVCFDTFGCRLNRSEALEIEAKYVAAGWTVVKSHADADLIIVRGCSVTGKAERDCERVIAHLKKKYPTTNLIVEGCYRAKEGVHQISDTGYVVPTSTARAYLKVQDGCNSRCSFCIVPQFRGNAISVSFDDVLDRAKRFIDSGYREIVVTGCNLSQYLSKGKRLPELLAALAGLGGCRIRLGSLEPGPIALSTVEVMAESENICRFLHLPVQSGSNHMLMTMNRPYLVRDVLAIVRSATKLMPTLGLGCDLMTGFPGETEIDFIATSGLFKRLPFSNAHVFPYSKRPGTSAARLTHEISPEVRTERARELTAKAFEKRCAFARSFIGKEVEIIVEDTDRLGGWTSEYLWCSATRGMIESLADKTPRKSLLRFRVTQVKDDRLHGTPIA